MLLQLPILCFQKKRTPTTTPHSLPPLKSQLLARQQFHTRSPDCLCESRGKPKDFSFSSLWHNECIQGQHFKEPPSSAPKREGEPKTPQCPQSIPVWEAVTAGGETGRKEESPTLDSPGGWEAIMADCVQCSVRSASVLMAG